MKLGFIGLGVMGGAMCRNLAGDGRWAVRTHDLDPARVVTGATAVETSGAVAEGAGIVFLVLPGEAEVRRAVLGRGGMIEHMGAGAILVDCGTSPPALARELAQRLGERDIGFADAPIAGTAASVARREISLMVGAEPAIFTTIEAPLQAMAKTVMRCGGFGAGQTVKLLLNMVLAEQVGALAEALVLARAAGVEGAILFEALAGGADSFALRQHGFDALLPDDFPEGRFPTRYMLKDLDYLETLRAELGVELEGLALARRRLAASMAAGDEDAYWPAFIHSL